MTQTMRGWITWLVSRSQRPPVAMALFAALLATQILPYWSPTPDAAGYLSIARSIARGGPLANMGSPKLHYPPGYPLLISPLFLVADRPLALLIVEQWIFAVVYMLGVYYWARRSFGSGALVITALVMANASFWMFARQTLSEMPFMALLVWTAIAMNRLAEATRSRDVAKWCAIVGLMTAALSLVRPVGILIITGYALMMLSCVRQGRASWRRALATTSMVALPAALVVVSLLAYEAHTAALVGIEQGATYLHEFKMPDVSLAAQLLEGVRIRTSEIGRLLVPGMFKTYAPAGVWLNVNLAIFVAVLAAVVWGWWHVARRTSDALVLTLPCYLALYIAYPSDQGVRYMLPMLPVLAVSAWWLICQAPRHRQQLLAGLVVAHLLVAVGYSIRETIKLRRINAQWPAVDVLADVLRDDPRVVLPCRLPFGIRDMAMLTADHYIHEPCAGDQIPADVDWILAPAGTADCAGFTEHARAGDFKLLLRVESLSRAQSIHAPR
jgi:4-amino-4-deoxy-L-arabinose transferase-like glycosyltransferase